MGVLFHAVSFYMGASFSSQTWNVRIPILSQGIEGDGRSKKRRKGGGGGERSMTRWGRYRMRRGQKRGCSVKSMRVCLPRLISTRDTPRRVFFQNLFVGREIKADSVQETLQREKWTRK